MEMQNYRTFDRTTDTERYEFPSELPKRPGLSNQGKAIQVRVNQFKIKQWVNRDVYQYDVSFHL